MTAPRDRFGAHDRDRLGTGDLNECFESFGELRCGHVVGVTAEGCVSPTGVDGVFARVATATERLQMCVADAGGVKRGFKHVCVELRAVARFWD